MDLPLLALARTQHGAVTTHQAACLGVGRYELERLVRDGVLLHPCRGLYIDAASLDGSPEGKHRGLCAGALLLYPDATLTGVSAVLAHGLPVWGADLTKPDVHRPVDRSVGVRGCRDAPGRRRPAGPSPSARRSGRLTRSQRPSCSWRSITG